MTGGGAYGGGIAGCPLNIGRHCDGERRSAGLADCAGGFGRLGGGGSGGPEGLGPALSRDEPAPVVAARILVKFTNRCLL